MAKASPKNIDCAICGAKMRPWALDVCPACREIIMQEMGRKGGQTTKARYGTEHFQEIGRLGGLKLKRRAVTL